VLILEKLQKNYLENENKQCKYKVGKYLDNGKKFYNEKLEPMSHLQATTFISKMAKPADWFLIEID